MCWVPSATYQGPNWLREIGQMGQLMNATLIYAVVKLGVNLCYYEIFGRNSSILLFMLLIENLNNHFRWLASFCN